MVKRQLMRLNRLRIPIMKLLGKPLSSLVREFRVQGHLVAEVTLTEEMINAAREMAFKIRQAARRSGLQEVITASLKEEVVGLEGHFAWMEYAFGHWREGLQYLNVGAGDTMDSAFRDHSVDVKTRSQPWHDLLMIPERQFHHKPHDFYIGAQKRGPQKVWIMGYAAYDDVKHAKIDDFGHGPTYIIPFMKLKSINDMLKLKPKKEAKE